WEASSNRRLHRSHCLEPHLTDDELLELLCCPVSGEPLEFGDGVLSAEGGSGRRYPVQERIPILLPDVDEPAVRSQITAYRTRGASYYRDNYGGANPQRDARLGLVTDLLEGLVRPGADVLEAGA